MAREITTGTLAL